MDLIEKCDKCELHECINCEHSWADIQEIKQQLKGKENENEVLRKALELACDTLIIGDDDVIDKEPVYQAVENDYNSKEYLHHLINYFIRQAKEQRDGK